MRLDTAIRHIEKEGALLVFPIKNRKDPKSLWSAFYPRSEMRWEWDQDGDHRVADLWHLRKRLSESGKVVYVKWYQGRATCLSRAIFPSLLRLLNPHQAEGLSHLGQMVFDALEEDSPLSTKVLKIRTDLRGRSNESLYNKATNELWRRLLMVGFGEVDEGAFPSLAMGSTRLLFEDLWDEAWELTQAQARKNIEAQLAPVFRTFLQKQIKS